MSEAELERGADGRMMIWNSRMSKKLKAVGKKMRKANSGIGNFSNYIYRVLKLVHPGRSSDDIILHSPSTPCMRELKQ